MTLFHYRDFTMPNETQANREHRAAASEKVQVDVGAPLLERLRAILAYFSRLMEERFESHALERVETDPQFAAELRAAAETYKEQAKQALQLIKSGAFTIKELKQVTGTLYVTNLTLRWVLEQQTDTFHRLLDSPNPSLGMQIRQARDRFEADGDHDSFEELLRLVSLNRSHFALLMIIGFLYLKKKKNVTFAMKYFEKAAQTPPTEDARHFRNLALEFLAICHEGKQQYKNALYTLLQAAKAGPLDSPMLFDIARMYGRLGDHEKAVEYFDQAVRKRPEFLALALTEGSFKTVKEKVENKAREHTEAFRELAEEFAGMVEPVLDIIERYHLERYSKRLHQSARVTRFNIGFA
ncbi:hypothetical protein GF324_03485, partial [bacterium]|nr:hypothetical protein [bacterium]